MNIDFPHGTLELTKGEYGAPRERRISDDSSLDVISSSGQHGGGGGEDSSFSLLSYPSHQSEMVGYAAGEGMAEVSYGAQQNGKNETPTTGETRWNPSDWRWNSTTMTADPYGNDDRHTSSPEASQPSTPGLSSDFDGAGPTAGSTPKRMRLASGAGPMLSMVLKAEEDTGLDKITLGQFKEVKVVQSKKGAETKKAVPACQVADCKWTDLKGLKDYHLRYKICEEHLKAQTVVIDGIMKRFCQQCGRFHDVSDFDDNKRSCRAGLDSHNVRRRKVQWNKNKKSNKKSQSRSGGRKKGRDSGNADSSESSGLQSGGVSGSGGRGSKRARASSSGAYTNTYNSVDDILRYNASGAGSELDIGDMGPVGADLFGVVEILSADPARAGGAIFDAAKDCSGEESYVATPFHQGTPPPSSGGSYDAASPVTQMESMSTEMDDAAFEFTSSGEFHDASYPSLDDVVDSLEPPRPQSHAAGGCDHGPLGGAGGPGGGAEEHHAVGAGGQGAGRGGQGGGGDIVMFPELPEDLELLGGLFSGSDGVAASMGDPLTLADMSGGGSARGPAGQPHQVPTPPGPAIARGQQHGGGGAHGLAHAMVGAAGAAAPYPGEDSVATLTTKILKTDPGQLPPEMLASISSWLGAAPDSVKSVIRPGCTVLTVDAELRGEGALAAARERGAYGAAAALLAGPAGAFFRSVDMSVQLGAHVATVRQGEVVNVLCVDPEVDEAWAPEGAEEEASGEGAAAPVVLPLQPVIERVEPCCVLASEASTIRIAGRLPVSSAAGGVSARFHGRWVPIAPSNAHGHSNGHSNGAAAAAAGQEFLFACPPAGPEEGAMAVEAADGDLASDPKPVLVTKDPRVRAEVSTLAAAVAAGAMLRGDADALVWDLGATLPEAAWGGIPATFRARKCAVARTCLEHALARGWPSVAKALLARLKAAGGLQGVGGATAGQSLLTRAVRSGDRRCVKLVMRERLQQSRARAGKGVLAWIGHPCAAGAGGVTPLHLAAILGDGGRVAGVLTAWGGAALAWFLARDADGNTPSAYAAKAAGGAKASSTEGPARRRLAAGLNLAGAAVGKSSASGGEGAVEHLRAAVRLVGDLKRDLARGGGEGGEDAAAAAAIARQLLLLGVQKAERGGGGKARGAGPAAAAAYSSSASSSGAAAAAASAAAFSPSSTWSQLRSLAPVLPEVAPARFNNAAAEKLYVAEANARDRKLDLLCYYFLYLINLADVIRLVRGGVEKEVKTVTTVAMASNILLTGLIFTAHYFEAWYVKRREPIVMCMRIIWTVCRWLQLIFVLREPEHFAFAMIQSLASCFYRVRMFRHLQTQLLCFPINLACSLATGSMHDMGIASFVMARVVAGIFANSLVVLYWEARARKGFLERNPDVAANTPRAEEGRGGRAAKRVTILNPRAFASKYWGRIRPPMVPRPFKYAPAEATYLRDSSERKCNLDVACYFLATSMIVVFRTAFRLVPTYSEEGEGFSPFEVANLVAKWLLVWAAILLARYRQAWYMEHREAIVAGMRVVGTLWHIADDVLMSHEYFSFVVWGSLVSALYHIRLGRQLKVEAACMALHCASAWLLPNPYAVGFWLRRALVAGCTGASLCVVYTLEAHWRHQFLARHPKYAGLEDADFQPAVADEVKELFGGGAEGIGRDDEKNGKAE